MSEISIYTYDAEKPLAEVMRNIAIKENKGPAISHKEDNAKLVAYFTEIFQNMIKKEYILPILKNFELVQFVQAKGLVSK